MKTFLIILVIYTSTLAAAYWATPKFGTHYIAGGIWTEWSYR